MDDGIKFRLTNIETLLRAEESPRHLGSYVGSYIILFETPFPVHK
jgi:hypothetical protein